MAPPRGRTTRTAGLHRIDAAFDALTPLGFSREVIKMTIENLLQILSSSLSFFLYLLFATPNNNAYGGDEGWVFVEEASYKLVIEAILEQQEEEDQKQNNIELEGENVEIEKQVADAGSTSQSVAIESDGQQCDGLPVRGRWGPDLGRASGQMDGCDEGYTKLLSVTYEDTYPDNHSAVAELVAPMRKRPPCYGWISESESDSESDE